MVGAGALSRKKLAWTPASIAPMQTATATISIRPKLRTSRKAMAPGAIKRPTARISPVAVIVATLASDRMVSSP